MDGIEVGTTIDIKRTDGARYFKILFKNLN
jgi:hypothetical protein